VLVQPHAEVAVLGDIERVPAAKLLQWLDAEVIARATKRDRRAGGRQARQEEVEPDRVLRGEPACEQVLPLVIVVELRLDAGDVLRRAAEGEGSALELIGLRAVLRVVDHKEVGLAGEEAVVAGLRLGLGLAVGDDDRADVRRKLYRLRGLDRLAVILLEQQHHIELLLRVIHPPKALNQPPEDRRLPVERDQQRVGRQGGLVEARKLLGCGVHEHRALERDRHEVELVGGVDHVEGDQYAVEGDERRERPPEQQRHKQQRECNRADRLPARDGLAGALIGPLVQNPQDRDIGGLSLCVSQK